MSRFDAFIDRKNSSCRKWDGYLQAGYEEDVLPLWVADMDVQTVDEVTNAIVERAKMGVFGYTITEEGTTAAICGWMKRRFDWDVKEEWIVHTPGVVYALHLCVQQFTNKGDAIIINPPVYPPFARSVVMNDRKLVKCPLVLENQTYHFDANLFEQMIIENEVKMFIFCNPHNPVGKVYTEAEIRVIGNICLKHNVMVISDEIHEDFVYPHKKHIPFTKVDVAFEANTIICTAPSKTFNLAGMQFSNIIIPSEALRKTFVTGMELSGIHMTGSFSSLACKMAYLHGDAYVDELVAYVQSNVAYVRAYLQEKLPMITMIEPDALYLLWLDFRDLRMGSKQLEEFLITKAKVWLNQGYTFGGEGFVRMNLACHRSTLEQAMHQMDQAIHQYLRTGEV